jgi:flagellar hook protein FlgE
MSSFATPLSGLLSNEQALNVIGDNIANMNTQGFKSSSVLFEDAMNEVSGTEQIGAGVGSTLTERNFTQGTLDTTGGATDAAIQGNGFFVLQNPSTGATTYTRDGTFNLNASGQLMTQTGQLVEGWSATNGVVNTSGPVSPITLPSISSQPPSATANMTTSANLDASAAVGTSFDVPIQVVDSLGNTHTLTVDFTNTAPLQWSYNVTIPGADVSGGTAGTPSTLATGTLTFNSSGVLTSPAAGSPIDVKSAALSDGAAALGINWSLYGSTGNPLITQYASASATTGTTQDGVQAASVTSTTIQNGGLLVATFSDGSQQTVGQLALASVPNPDSLVSLANNQYTVGANTATPSVGASGTGAMGSVVGGALESSNVDMATELTNLIVYQRAYQADSKSLTAIDQMQQTLIALNL